MRVIPKTTKQYAYYYCQIIWYSHLLSDDFVKLDPERLQDGNVPMIWVRLRSNESQAKRFGATARADLTQNPSPGTDPVGSPESSAPAQSAFLAADVSVHHLPGYIDLGNKVLNGRKIKE